MATLKLTTTATVPSGSTLSITIYEDVGGDGSGASTDPNGRAYDNTATQSIDDGTNSYTFTGFSLQTGDDLWIQVDEDNTDPTTTASLDSATVAEVATESGTVSSTSTLSAEEFTNFEEPTITSTVTLSATEQDISVSESGKVGPGRALSFDGDDWVVIPDSPSLDLTGDMTISIWLNADSSGGRRPMDKGLRNDNIGYGFFQGTASDDYLAFRIGDGVDKVGVRWNGWNNADGITLVTGVYDSDDSELRIYGNGELKNTTSVAISPAASNFDLYLGRRADFNGQHFVGDMDDILIYNRVLSDSEIADIYRGKVSEEKLVHRYKFDEEQGPNTRNSGKFTEGPHSLSFDGVDDEVVIENPPEPQKLTISAWGRVDNIPDNWATIVSSRTGSNEGYWIFMNNNETDVSFSIGFTDGTRTHPDLTISGEVSLGKLALFTMTWDGTEAVAYIDGRKVGSNSDFAGKTIEHTGFLRAGFDGQNDYPLDGIADDVRLYDRALSPFEVENLYNGEDITRDLVGHWKFDEGSGGTTIDSAGSNDGTINGAVYVENNPDGTIDGATYTEPLDPSVKAVLEAMETTSLFHPIRSWEPVEYVEETVFTEPVDDPAMQWIGLVEDYSSTTEVDSKRFYLTGSTDKVASRKENVKLREELSIEVDYIPQDFTFLQYFTGADGSISDSMPSIQVGERQTHATSISGGSPDTTEEKRRRLLGCFGEKWELTIPQDQLARVSATLSAVQKENWSETDYIGAGSHATESAQSAIAYGDVSNIQLGGQSIREYVSELKLLVDNRFTVFTSPDSSKDTEIDSVVLNDRQIKVGMTINYADSHFAQVVTSYDKQDFTFDIGTTSFTVHDVQFPVFEQISRPADLIGMSVTSDPASDMTYG